MNGALERLWSDWISGAIGARSGEGVAVSLEHSWPWPPWVALLALLLLGSGVAWAYLSDPRDVPRRLRLSLAVLRIGLVALLLFMMYGWMLHRHRTDLPDLIIVLDRSQSMELVDQYQSPRLREWVVERVQRSGWQTPSRWHQALALLLDPQSGWLDRLEQHYRLKVYLIGEDARLVGPAEDLEELSESLRREYPEDAASRLGASVEQILAAQRGRPTAALILLSDGITTSGRPLSEVAEQARRKAIPFYIVGLGDDHPPRDVRVEDVLVDEVVFVDDVVHFDFSVGHEGFADREARVTLQSPPGGEVLDQTDVTLGGSSGSQTVRLTHRPRREGEHEYAIHIEPLEGEANRENNTALRTVRVRNATIRVLLVQEYPSYEFRTLKNLLGRLVKIDSGEKLIDLTTILQEADFDYAEQDATAERVFPVSRESLLSYDVVLFGDVNPTYLSQSVMENLNAFVTERGGGLVFMAGPRFTPLAYRKTPLEDLLPVNLTSAAVPDPSRVLNDPYRMIPTALGRESPLMQLGDTAGATDTVWRELPYLYWYLSAPELRPAARVLAVHPTRTAADGSLLPLITMQFVGAGKVVLLGTDETYRWSQHQGNDMYYSRFWLQMLRYLSRAKLLSDRQPAEIVTDRTQYLQGEPVRLRVRFFDERAAPLQDDGVRVLIQESGGRRREVTLARDEVERGQFSALVAELPPGDYRAWLAAPPLEQQPAPQRFVIQPPASEQARLEMDAADLQRAAELSRGGFYRFARAARLMRDLPRGRQVRVESLPAEPVWNSAWLAGLFVAMITAEWLLRKRAGMV